ncbi:MAG: hypothetical protein V7707_00385 [Motiliproteus sp.]
MLSDNIQYRLGNTRVKAALAGLGIVTIWVVFSLQGFITQTLVDVQLLLGSDPRQALLVISRLLLGLVISSALVSVAIGCYLCLMAVRVSHCGEYPPPQMPVAFKTRIYRGAEAAKKRRGCLLVAAVMFLQPLLGMGLWYSMTGGVL